MKKEKKPSASYLKGSIVPSWIDTESTETLGNGVLEDLVMFYVVYCPCKQYATQGRNLSYYKWKDKPWSPYRYLKCALDADAKGFKCKIATEWYNLKQVLDDNGLSGNDWCESNKEYAIYSNVESNEFMSMLYHIRCAFAHGRFTIKQYENEKYYCFENGIPQGKSFLVKARMVIKESTLLRWRTTISSGPSKEEARIESASVLSEITVNPSITEANLSKKLGVPLSYIRKAIEELKKSINMNYIRTKVGQAGYWGYDMKLREKYYPGV